MEERHSRQEEIGEFEWTEVGAKTNYKHAD